MRLLPDVLKDGFHVDHIVALSKKGRHERRNVQLTSSHAISKNRTKTRSTLPDQPDDYCEIAHLTVSPILLVKTAD